MTFSKLHLDSGPMKIPQILLPKMQPMPICYHEAAIYQENIIRLSHVICRSHGIG